MSASFSRKTQLHETSIIKNDLLRLNRVYYGRVIYIEHKHYRLIKTGKYIQKSLRPSREAWLALDR